MPAVLVNNRQAFDSRRVVKPGTGDRWRRLVNMNATFYILVALAVTLLCLLGYAVFRSSRQQYLSAP